MEILNSASFKSKVFDYETNPEWRYNGAIPAIVDFYADWCAPCRALAPVLEQISAEYAGQIQVYKVNTEDSPELAALFGIRSIPSILFIPKTGTPAMSAGLIPKEALKKAVDDMLAGKLASA